MSDEGTVGVVGAGNIGSVVARLAAKAGLEVVIANSRGPESLAGLVDELGPGVRAGSVDQAARAGECVVVAIPFFRFRDLPAAAFADRTVIDTMNFDPGRDGAVAALIETGQTPAELLAARLAGASVVKAFSSIFANHLAALSRPAGAPDRSALPIAGDSIEAKLVTTRLLDRLGWDAVDAGSLKESRRFDLGTPAFVVPYVADASDGWGLRLPTDPGSPAGATRIGTLLGQRLEG